jgi:hypothetical protein
MSISQYAYIKYFVYFAKFQTKICSLNIKLEFFRTTILEIQDGVKNMEPAAVVLLIKKPSWISKIVILQNLTNLNINQIKAAILDFRHHF